MSHKFTELTEEQFDEQFPLVSNHLNPNASWVFGDDPGCLFETYGEELAYIRQQDPSPIRTIVDGDDGVGNAAIRGSSDTGCPAWKMASRAIS